MLTVLLTAMSAVFVVRPMRSEVDAAAIERFDIVCAEPKDVFPTGDSITSDSRRRESLR